MKRILIPALIALGLTAAVACGTTEQTAKQAPPATSSTLAKTPTPTVKPKPAEKTTTTKPAAPDMTRSQEQAIESAQDYLQYMAFSRKGLIKQLSSE
jgi:hypothetical protein